MTSGVRLLQLRRVFAASEWCQIRDIGAVDAIVSREAMRALAQALVMDSALEQVIEEPDPKSKDPARRGQATITWSLGVVDREAMPWTEHLLADALDGWVRQIFSGLAVFTPLEMAQVILAKRPLPRKSAPPT